MVFVSSIPSCLCFSPPSHPFLQGLIYFNQVSIYSCEVSSLFSINVLIRWFPMKMLNSFKFIILHCCFFSGGSNSSFVDHILSLFQMSSLANAPLYHSLLPIHLFWSAEDISEDLCFHSQSIQDISRLLSHSSHIIQPVQSPLSINRSMVYLLVGPNTHVFSQDLTWLF